MSVAKPRTSVVLFNLGGPDGPDAVAPFLFNLFNDPAIISLPGLLRRPLAKFISKRRAPAAREIYAHLGGASPLLALTREQAAALAGALAETDPETKYSVTVAMRYWKPFADEAAAEVKAFNPENVVMLPLYPQFSTTTTGSSFADFNAALDRAGVKAARRRVCCYPAMGGLITAHAALTREALAKARAEAPGAPVRVLFSAHGLPEKIIRGGDPYQWQIEQTAAAVAAAMAEPGLDWRVCYQSRVGPMKWIGPATDGEIIRAGAEGRALVVVPIAFVSEHSETLVELDIEYAELAQKAGVKAYARAPALGTAAPFIQGLAETAVQAARGDSCVRSAAGPRLCPVGFSRCPHPGPHLGPHPAQKTQEAA
ncbi:MAG: ferrochelatase [Rhodospirillales bacterium]